MTKALKRRRNTYFVLALLVVGFLFSYYFFGHIPKREKDLNDRGIRVMNRMSRNLIEREDHYRKSLSLFECDYLVRALAVAVKENANQQGISKRDLFNGVFRNSNCKVVKGKIEKRARELAGNSDDLGWLSFLTQAGEEYADELVNVDPIVKLLPLAKVGKSAFVDTLDKDIGAEKFGLAIVADDFTSEIKQYVFFSDIFLTDPETHQVIDHSELGFKYFNYIPSVEAGSAADSLQNGLIQDENGIFLVPNVDITTRNIANTTILSFTSNVSIQGKQYYLHGIIEKGDYNDKVRAVSIWVIVVSVVLLLFLVQILPIIKPFVISPKERLGGIDVIWSVIALIFGLSALSILLVGIDTFAIEDIKLINKKLELYSDSIAENFKEERNGIIATLKNIDPKGVDDKDWVGDNKTRILDLRMDGTAWYYELGKNDKLKLLSESIDLSHRSYYKILSDPSQQDIWKDENQETPYYVESLYSLSQGAYETVIGIKRKDKILAAVTPLKSTNNLYLEPNYQFAIVDQEGVIHYHTQQSKIKNENLIEESNQNANLIAYLKNSSDRSFAAEFSLNDYRAHIKPLTGTPWHVITMYNIRKSRLTVTSSMVISFVIILAILAFMFFLHFLFKISSNMASTEKDRGFLYLFLSPVSTPPKVHLLLAIVNAITIIVLLLIYRYNPLVIGYSIVAYMGVLSTSILFNYIVLVKYSFNIDEVIGSTLAKKVTVFEIGLMVFSLIWLIAAIAMPKENDWLAAAIVLYQVLQLLAYLFVRIRRSYFVILSTTPPKRHYRTFYLHTLTWILMISFIPSLLFFKPIYNLQHINLGMESWLNELYYRNINNIRDDNKVTIFSSKPDSTGKVAEKDINASLRLIEDLRPAFDKEIENLKGLQDGLNNRKTITLGFEESLGLPFYEIKPGLSTHFQSNITPKPSKVVAFALPSIIGGKVYDWAFWSIIAIVLLIVYLTIKKLSEQFFYLHLLEHLRAVKAKRAFGNDNETNQITNTAMMDGQSNLMIVGPPYSGRNEIAKELVADNKRLLYLDFLNDIAEEEAKFDAEVEETKAEIETISQAEKKSESETASKLVDTSFGKTIIINNFDYRVFDFENNKAKLKLLEKIIRYRNELQLKQRLILICHFGTKQLIDAYYAHKLELKRIKASADEIDEIQNDMYRWESVLFGFITHVVALESSDSYGWIDRELDHGQTLKTLKPQIELFEERVKETSSTLNEFELRERIIDAIKDMAQNLYYSIWNSCSRDERFLLYDIAQDGIVNSNNEDVIIGLVRKGILIPEPSLRIFNVSFSRFVIDNISEEEGTLMERQAKKEGIFSSYRFFVLFLILVIVVFFSFVERSSVARIMSILTLSASLLPRLLSSLSLMNATNFNFKKKSDG